MKERTSWKVKQNSEHYENYMRMFEKGLWKKKVCELCRLIIDILWQFVHWHCGVRCGKNAGMRFAGSNHRLYSFAIKIRITWRCSIGGINKLLSHRRTVDDHWNKDTKCVGKQTYYKSTETSSKKKSEKILVNLRLAVAARCLARLTITSAKMPTTTTMTNAPRIGIMKAGCI